MHISYYDSTYGNLKYMVLDQCSDGIDNDDDGEIDYADDSSCTSPDDPSEFVPCWRIQWLLPFLGDVVTICLVEIAIVLALTAVTASVGWWFYRRRRRRT